MVLPRITWGVTWVLPKEYKTGELPLLQEFLHLFFIIIQQIFGNSFYKEEIQPGETGEAGTC